MTINYDVNRLIQFGLNNGLLTDLDKVYSATHLVCLLQLSYFYVEEVPQEVLVNPASILKSILDYACQKGLIEDTVVQRDLFDTAIMNVLMPRPNEVIRSFRKKYEEHPEKATEYYYDLSLASNYIRKERTDKNIVWKSFTECGELDITINLSKPEKDPRDIEKEKYVQEGAYPKCLLCIENEGYFGHINHPARQNHRIIPLELNQESWYLQYSPYAYYLEHCIVLKKEHEPMKMNEDTFKRLVDFVEQFPHYFLGSNADLPIVGGSILSHDHFQGGKYQFPMERAKVSKIYNVPRFGDIKAGRVVWPMSVLRLRGKEKERVVAFAGQVLERWKKYSDEKVEIRAYTGETPHNTITPIARMVDGEYELDLVLRNNRTNKEYPLGIFHPHQDVHHIKRENVGLIEVMGLAVLPPRLERELEDIATVLISKSIVSEVGESLEKHKEWITILKDKYPFTSIANVQEILRKEVGIKFARVLHDAGVFKSNREGNEAFSRFMATL